MTYPVISSLNQLWNSFEACVNEIYGEHYPRLADLQKLMTAESVIDLSAHEIYSHARLVHDWTLALLNLKNSHPDNKPTQAICEHWLNLLRARNQAPLKLLHHQRLDGECDFKFSLQLMEGKPCGFKEISVLEHQKTEGLDKVVKEMYQLGCTAHGHSFGGLPLMKDKVLTALMEYQDTICLLARDQSDQVIGYTWGLMLRDVEVGKDQKANIFWIMDLARDPDFYDEHTKVGEQLRARMVEELMSRNDCDFVGYQHVLNHKFHMDIVSDAQHEDEHLFLGDADRDARSTVQYSEDVGLYMRAHFIRANAKHLDYPLYETIKPAIITAFWRASHSAKDFIVGGIAFAGLQKYQQVSHKLLDKPVEQRIVAAVSKEQQARDIDVLRQIILSDQWSQQGKSLFSTRHVPDTIGRLQELVRDKEFVFQAIKSCVASRGKSPTRGKLASVLYEAIEVADSPTFVLDSLLKSNDTPRDWIDLITTSRGAAVLRERQTIKLSQSGM